MNYPFGEPEDWQRQQEEARRWSAMQALAWAYSKAVTENDRAHISHLCFECGISEAEVTHFLGKKAA